MCTPEREFVEFVGLDARIFAAKALRLNGCGVKIYAYSDAALVEFNRALAEYGVRAFWNHDERCPAITSQTPVVGAAPDAGCIGCRVGWILMPPHMWQGIDDTLAPGAS